MKEKEDNRKEQMKPRSEENTSDLFDILFFFWLSQFLVLHRLIALHCLMYDLRK